MNLKKFSMKKYLEEIVKLKRRAYGKNILNKIGDYYCLEDFVLKNGQLFEPKMLPKKVRRGLMKECFRNAALLSMETSYQYVEGYALSIIPTIHAWCTDKKGRVIDPTWEDGKEYYGIIFKDSYLLKYLLKYKRYGLLENWENAYPLLTLDKKEWLRRI